MTADETLLAHTEQWGAELDQPTPAVLAQAQAVITAHFPAEGAGGVCACGHPATISHSGHVVQELAAAGLLVALTHLDERPAHAPRPRPAVRTGSFAAPGGLQHLSDGEG